MEPSPERLDHVLDQDGIMIQYLGYFAGVLTVASFMPQVIRSWRTRQTRDLSLGMFTLLTTASTLWILYGVLTADWPVILTNSGMVALNGALAVAKIRYR
jgi:MtN3 and saliva related transmembrane protein